VADRERLAGLEEAEALEDLLGGCGSTPRTGACANANPQGNHSPWKQQGMVSRAQARGTCTSERIERRRARGNWPIRAANGVEKEPRLS